MLRLSRKYRNEVSDSVAGPHLAYDGSQNLFVDPTSTMSTAARSTTKSAFDPR
jgi:hypothetical protein